MATVSRTAMAIKIQRAYRQYRARWYIANFI